MKGKPNICTAEKATKVVRDFWFGIKHIDTLWISPNEEAALDKMGYDPNRMVCIERFDDESIFAEVTISKPIRIGLKDGGGKPYKFTHSNTASANADIKAEVEKLKQENKELLKMNQELQTTLTARLEALEARRTKNAR